MSCVLDASALLAFLQDEPGAVAVEQALSGSLLSSVNWSEVVQKSLVSGVDVCGMRQDVEALGVAILPFTTEEAEHAADLWPKTRRLGLSLGDHACLALALRTGSWVLTADRAWENLQLDLAIQVIR